MNHGLPNPVKRCAMEGRRPVRAGDGGGILIMFVPGCLPSSVVRGGIFERHARSTVDARSVLQDSDRPATWYLQVPYRAAEGVNDGMNAWSQQQQQHHGTAPAAEVGWPLAYLDLHAAVTGRGRQLEAASTTSDSDAGWMRWRVAQQQQQRRRV